IEQDCASFTDLIFMPEIDAAKKIHADGIHILIDLMGYTSHAKTEILGLRPCPIQVNYLGYPGTMGADFMDYIIVDKIIVPEHQADCYSEQLFYVPHCYQVN